MVSEGETSRMVRVDRPLLLAHVNLSSAVSNLYFIHQLIDEVYAASVVGVEIFAIRGIRNGHRIVALSGIADNNKEPVLFITPDTAFDILARIVLATVLDCIRQRFAKGSLDFQFLALGTLH